MESKRSGKHGGVRLIAAKALYLHIPFCGSKCPYCSFSSFPGLEHLYERYVHCLQKEIVQRYTHLRGCRLESLFIGGGTPTVLHPGFIVKLVDFCRDLFGFAEKAEISIEANPGTVNLETLELLKGSGVNRLSLGVQAFAEEELKRIGRIYSPADIYQAYKNARSAGFENISLDLMYGLPGQNVDCWRGDLDRAFSLGPEHLSLYQLSIDEKTLFYELFKQGVLEIPAEDTILEMDDVTLDSCAAAGYERYEISNFSRRGHECRHNLTYWKNEDYMACGAGAVSFSDGVRAKNTEDPAIYCSMLETGINPTAESEKLGLNEAFRETVMLGLRLTKGVSAKRLYRRFGLDLKMEYGELLEDMIDQELLVLSSGYLRLTETGLKLANRVMAELI